MKSLFIAVLVCFLFANQSFAQGLKVRLTEHTANVETVAYSTNGLYFVSSGWDGAVNLYTIDSVGVPVFKQSFLGHLGAVTSLNFSKNNKFIISCGKDYSARIWNIEFPDSSKTFNMHYESVTNAFLDASGKNIITCSVDGTIKNTNIYDSRKSKTIKVGKSINDLVISRDGKFYYAALKGGTIAKIETGSTKTIAEFTGHNDEINTLDISPDGKFLASGSSDKTIIIWDLITGKELKKLIGFEWKVTCVKFSSDGQFIIGGCNDGTTKLFDVNTGKLISDFAELSKNVRDVAFSANAKQIAIATNLESANYGAVIYNSGVFITSPEPANRVKGSKPVVKGNSRQIVKPTVKVPVK
ncbi:MAG: WD40 repeat domain-containing protein [bacterium]|nr:WD40 repeat domain-containing protein [bacterium]